MYFVFISAQQTKHTFQHNKFNKARQPEGQMPIMLATYSTNEVIVSDIHLTPLSQSFAVRRLPDLTTATRCSFAHHSQAQRAQNTFVCVVIIISR